MRDTHATGTGSMMGAGTAGYCVGNLQLDGAPLPHEDPSFAYPDSLASPAQIMIDASNGASDYGNKFGEPLVCGYTRTFGQRLANGERREYLKPIMFTAGVGALDDEHAAKGDAGAVLEIPREAADEVRKGAAPFISWLEEAEDSDSSEE